MTDLFIFGCSEPKKKKILAMTCFRLADEKIPTYHSVLCGGGLKGPLPVLADQVRSTPSR